MNTSTAHHSDKIHVLQAWLREHGGYLHDSVTIAHNPEDGLHMRAIGEVLRDVPVISVPISLTLSPLNAMVDDELPAFRDNAHSFTIEALGFFYLMSQYIHKEHSFWKPYLDLLPEPDNNLNTPFWFDKADLQWLHETDVAHSHIERENVWRAYWTDGIRVLARAGVDTMPYTWTLFKWAATMFSSRSFGSRALSPQSTSRWPVFKQEPVGRQPATIDLRDRSAEDQSFPVLFPAMDAMNHSNNAKVDWDFAPGRFSFQTCDPVEAGQQIYNNYGPKSNTELLMGYGFCDAKNPFDCVLETLRQPSLELQRNLRVSHPDCFKVTGAWRPEAATFQLFPPESSIEDPHRCWDGIPHTLLELFYYTVRFERGLEFHTIRDPLHHLLNREGSRYLPRIAFYIVSSLLPKMEKLDRVNETLPQSPTNTKQRMAQVYRNGQLRIMRAIREGLGQFLHSLRPPVENGGQVWRHSALWTIDEILWVCRHDAPEMHEEFVDGLGYSFDVSRGFDKMDKREAHDVWLLWTCFAHLYYRRRLVQYDDDRASIPEVLLVKYMHGLETEYGRPITTDRLALRAPLRAKRSPSESQAAAYLGCAQTAAENLPQSIWAAKAWTSDFVLDWGLRIVQSEGMLMKLANDSVGYVVYLHVDDDDDGTFA